MESKGPARGLVGPGLEKLGGMENTERPQLRIVRSARFDYLSTLFGNRVKAQYSGFEA
jgi:hypothetical protein